ncbi:GGDEF domain-containing protein [Chitinimonas sp. BJYL2]|uniref:GGDEF domain-containing protein n=1 Tax=Chitinimonas sp. BJYL2 TaxID=2976696 RepID=UPI0022B3B9DA|nr:GGDEF domain-containing protein [Chitinimonas sp. BJYL2]
MATETLEQTNARLRKRLIRMASMLQAARYGEQHDPLTGLANRSLMMDRLQQSLALANRMAHQVAVLMIDLDGFKMVNDNFGHQAGDQLLQQVAERLVTCIRDCDTAARVGGDEFVVLLPQIATATALPVVMDKLRRSLGAPYVLEHESLHIGASIGVATCKGMPLLAKDLLALADRDMYLIKQTKHPRVAPPETDLPNGSPAPQKRSLAH